MCYDNTEARELLSALPITSAQGTIHFDVKLDVFTQTAKSASKQGQWHATVVRMQWCGTTCNHDSTGLPACAPYCLRQVSVRLPQQLACLLDERLDECIHYKTSCSRPSPALSLARRAIQHVIQPGYEFCSGMYLSALYTAHVF
jgi:hypothetical protein